MNKEQNAMKLLAQAKALIDEILNDTPPTRREVTLEAIHRMEENLSDDQLQDLYVYIHSLL